MLCYLPWSVPVDLAGAQSVTTVTYADYTGVHNATNIPISKACPVTVNDIHGILQHMASNEVVSYKWVPVCEKKMQRLCQCAHAQPQRGGEGDHLRSSGLQQAPRASRRKRQRGTCESEVIGHRGGWIIQLPPWVVGLGCDAFQSR